MGVLKTYSVYEFRSNKDFWKLKSVEGLLRQYNLNRYDFKKALEKSVNFLLEQKGEKLANISFSNPQFALIVTINKPQEH